MFLIRLFACQETQFDISDVNISHQHQFLSEALQWRAQTDPDHVLYVLLNAKVGLSHTYAKTNHLRSARERRRLGLQSFFSSLLNI